MKNAGEALFCGSVLRELPSLDLIVGVTLPDMLRIGAFFVAFGVAGRQLMGSALHRA